VVNADVKKINDALNDIDKAKSAALAAAEAKRKADEAAEKKKADDAAKALAAAKNRLDWAVSIGAEQQYTDQYERADSAYVDALTAQKSRDWDKTIDGANSTIAIVDAIETLKIGEARDAMSIAKERLDWAVGVKAADNYPDALASANASYALGERALTAKDWNSAIVAADAVLNALASVSDRVMLPAQYIVRTWQGVRDCLWNIAGYPWVYDDPFQWRTLLNANRDKLPDANDVSSLEPNTVLDIPSIRGEIRSGVWEEGKTYPDIPR
jgi:nucleoid-associated protein YgaU